MILHELRNASRRLLKRSGYTLLSLGVLGLGAMLFMLGAINGLVLEPLPFPQAERLVAIGQAREGSAGVGNLTSRDFLRLERDLRIVEALGTYGELTANVSHCMHGLRRYSGVWLSHTMLDLLGVRPMLGRSFSTEDYRPGAALTVLLGERVWCDDFGADPAIIGAAIRANGQSASTDSRRP